MRVRVVRFYQKKCNFCFQWAQQSSDVRSNLFCCNKCFDRISSQRFTLSTENSQIYKLNFSKQSQQKDENLNMISLSSYSNIKQEPKNNFLNWSNIKSLISDNQNYIQQIYINDLQQKQYKQTSSIIDPYDEYCYNQDNIKSFNDGYFQTNKQNQIVYKSFINLRNTQNNKASAIKSDLYGNRSQISINSNNQSVKKRGKYNFHYNKEEIERYKRNIVDQNISINLQKLHFQKDNQRQNCQRQFGTQLKHLNLSNIKFKSQNLNLKNSSFRKTKFAKLALSKSAISINERLTDQQLKNRIFPYLQQKSQSKTMNRLMATYVKEAYSRTNLNNKMLELISFKITTMDLQCYLNLFDFNHLNVVKLVKVGLTDEQFHLLMQNLQNYKVQILVLTSNNLTQNVLSYIQNRSFTYLKDIYIGKNRINKYKCKENISQLRNKYNIHI